MGTGRRIRILFILLCCAGFFITKISAQNVRIGLFDDEQVKTIVFHCTGGTYRAIGDSVFFRTIENGELVYLSIMGDKLVLMDGELHFGTFNHLEIVESSSKDSYRLKLVDPMREPGNYTGRLEINRFHGNMQLINEIPLDDYIAGVVEAEGGASASAEYYKAQAILCRSYAVKNWNKHPGQNFNLCNDTHCQSFQGISDENPGIPEAVRATHGLVLADQNYSIVSAIFHSNSGGETQRASDIWNSGDEYLQAVVDPFSLGLRSASWEKKISSEEWKQFLAKHFKSDVNKLMDEQLMIRQEHRKKYFIVGSDSILLSDIRNDFQLRSTFFTMEMQNDSILIHGKGYGHGVGMSQEGAMEMARLGYSYSDILRFYFYNVQIIELEDVPASALPENFL